MTLKKNTLRGDIVDVSRLGVTATRSDTIYLIASNIGRHGGGATMDEQRRLSSLLMRQFDWCFEASTTEPIEDAAKIFMSTRSSGIESLWATLELWSETHPAMIPGQLFAIPIMCEPLSASEMSLGSAEVRILLTNHIAEAVVAKGCDIYLQNRLYSDVELTELDWLQIKGLVADTVDLQNVPASDFSEDDTTAAAIPAVDVDAAIRRPYFIIGYVGARKLDRKIHESIFMKSDEEITPEIEWVRRLTSIVKKLMPSKNCEVAGSGMYSFHEGQRVASRMKKSASMLRQAHETLQKASMLPAEVRAFVSMHTPSNESDNSLIMRAAFVNSKTNDIIGGCDYPVAAMEDLASLEKDVTQCLQEIGIKEVRSIRLISTSSNCEGCGEALFLIPGKEGSEDPELHHATTSDGIVEAVHANNTFH